MASLSGTSSGSSLILNSASSEDLTAVLDQRKRKRMISNRESARRSRMRRQKHVDDLTEQVAQLRKDNHQIVARISAATQGYFAVEGENSVLRAQVSELTHRLQSLTDIADFLGTGSAVSSQCFLDAPEPPADRFFDPLRVPYCSQTMVASTALFDY